MVLCLSMRGVGFKEWHLGEILTADKRSPKPFFDCEGQGRDIISERGAFFYRANPGAGSEIRSAGPNLHPFPSMGLSV